MLGALALQPGGLFHSSDARWCTGSAGPLLWRLVLVPSASEMEGVKNSSAPSGGCVHRAGLLLVPSLVGVGVVGWAGVGEGEGALCASQVCVLILIPSAIVLQIRQRQSLFGLSSW